jgi:hypothetical protein
VQSYEDSQKAKLSQRYPQYDVWYVRSIHPRPYTTWHARLKGTPVATVNASTAEELTIRLDELNRRLVIYVDDARPLDVGLTGEIFPTCCGVRLRDESQPCNLLRGQHSGGHQAA